MRELKQPKPYRKAKRNRRRRRRGLGPAAAFVCFALVLAALASAAVIFFKIGSITVTGETVYTSEEIIEASGLEKGESMYLFNKFKAISSIASSCPYIDEIRIRRALPDGIEIIVTPCTAAAVIYSDFVYYIIDENGKILENAGRNQPENMAVVSEGELKNPQVGKTAVFSAEESSKALFSVLNTAKNSGILSDISSIDITKIYDIKFEYLGRFTVELGTADDIERKFKFVSAIIDALGDNERGVIDVSSGETGYFNQASN